MVEAKMKLLLLLLPAVLAAAPLEIIKPVISDSDGGAALPAGFEHVPGETLFFSCRISGYGKNPEHKVHLAYSVQAFDSKGVPLVEIYKNEISEEVTEQDKDWTPKINTEVVLPPLIFSGDYRVLVSVEDLVANVKTQLPVPFTVHARQVDPSASLTVRNFSFYRGEEDTQPVDKAVYRPGDGVWARFDITGFHYGPKNKIDVSYVTSVIAPSGKILWKQPEPAVEQAESFYPKPYVPAAMGITLQKNILPGEYTITVEVRDAAGGQTFEISEKFTIE
jgi:hypothetical protein